jgi:hypothetical protein
MKVSEQIESMAAQIATLRADVERLTADAASYKDALAKQQDAGKADVEAAAKAIAELTENLKAAQEQLTAAVADGVKQAARAQAAEDKLALVPALTDASDGQKPIADGGNAATVEISDWVAAVESKTGAERRNFYLAHREQIDRAYAQRGR